MGFLEFIRNKAFWTIDAFRGRSVYDSLKIMKLCNQGIWSEEQIIKYQSDSLLKLLNHTRDTVFYYKNVRSNNLKDWPVLKKDVIRSMQSQFMSTSYKKQDLIVMSTSGSTGTPFRCYQNIDKKRHVNAEVLYYNGLIGYEIGKRIVYFRSIVSETSKSKISQFFQNIILLDCANLDTVSIEKKLEIIEKKTKKSGGMILSYASTLDSFRKYFETNGYEKAKKCNVYGIVSGSELLEDITRDSLSKAFNCKVISRYANEENGFIGQDDEDANVFIPNRANYIVEILKMNSDTPIEEGEIGRIVITDLYNYAMPMIRYDTGDVGTWVITKHFGKDVKAIGNFGGRAIDMIYDVNGNNVSPHSISVLMWEYQNILQFQFIQYGPSQYKMKLISKDNKFEGEKKIISSLQELLGIKADISIEYCNNIPALSSGKRRYIVNEMH